MLRFFILCLGVMGMLPVSAAPSARGEAIYGGSTALNARIAGHSDVLPAVATACINCHAVNATAADNSAAPSILDGALARVQSRRNGPPGNYDAQRLCHALRSSTDPLQIRLPARMPRYDIGDEDCVALWQFLNTASP
jgi:hypothetical protein